MANTIYYCENYIDASDGIIFASVDNYSITHYDGSPRDNPGRALTQVPDGGWLHFRLAIPNGEYTSCMLFASSQIAGQKVEIRTGSLENTPIWTMTIATTFAPACLTDNLTANISYYDDDEQDIYVCFPNGFSGAINWLVFCQNAQTETDEAKLRRMQWFTDARFGHMMHWGAYSVLARGEWVMNTEQISKDEYIQEACIPFDPQNYDPESWADVIASTGQKYLTITTKHHDGFAMFDTNIIDFAPYDVENTASIHASVLEPLAAACRDRGTTFCAYYSLLDWANVNEVAIEAGAAEQPPNIHPDDVSLYLSELKEHLKEVIEVFDPALIWFDGAWAAFVDDNASELRWYLHRLSPDIIINNRIGGNPNQGDYDTPEQSIPASSQNTLWEACMTINNSWGYNAGDTNWKSTQTLLNDLLDCASKGGNLLLNTGPTADGIIPQPCLDRLSELGQWMDKWGRAIYATRAGTLDVSAQPGVYSTPGKDNTLYIILTQWPENKTLYIDMPQSLPAKAYCLDDPETPIAWHNINGLMALELPATPSDSLGVVLALEFDALPEARPLPDKALLRTADASNVWHGNSASYGPQFAVDGNSTTRWACDEVNNPVILTIDFGQSETFTRVSFLQFSARIDAFVIEAEMGGSWQQILEGNSPDNHYIGYLASPVTASAIRLTVNSLLDTTEPVSLYSFSVFDGNDTLLPVNLPVNIVRGAEASASSIWWDKPEYSAANACDGTLTTRWASSDNPVFPINWTVNFIKEEIFDLLIIHEFLSSDGTSRISEFSVQILAEDGMSWKEVYHGTDVSKTILLPRLTTSSGLRIDILQGVGTGGPSFYEVEIYQTVRTANAPLSNTDLMEVEARRSFEYFWREVNTTEGAKGYGLVASSAGERRSSIAGSGFALSALPIAVERNWIAFDAAQSRCQKTLQALLDNVPQYKGFFYHFIDMDTLDTGGSEVSTVDTMLAMNGILTAGQYFGGDCATLAQQIFDRVEWRNAIAPNGYYTMSWQETEGEMVMSTSTWGGYAEQFCLYPMAAGSTTFAPDDSAEMFYSLERKYGHYKDSGDLIYVWAGSLFTYQFSPAWINFSEVSDRNGADWWQNSVNATRANRQFCIDNQDIFPSMGENDWGLTACDSPGGYDVYGAPPSGNINANNMHHTDGTITPSGPVGSLPFMPEEALAAMNHWYQNPNLWGGYGFLDAYNRSTPAPWYSSGSSGLIKGLSLLMIENYRSGLVWKTYMNHPVLLRGLPKIFDKKYPETLFEESDP